MLLIMLTIMDDHIPGWRILLPQMVLSRPATTGRLQTAQSARWSSPATIDDTMYNFVQSCKMANRIFILKRLMIFSGNLEIKTDQADDQDENI